MSCEEYRKDIDGFLTGDISDERNSALIMHLAACEGCREHLKERRLSRGRGAAPVVADAGQKPSEQPVLSAKERRLATLNPILFAGILAVLLVGVVIAMKVRDTTGDYLDRTFWNVPSGGAAAEQAAPAAGMTDKEVEKFLANLAEELSAGGNEEAPGGDPAALLKEGTACLAKDDLPCATGRLRQATIAGRGTAAGEEARLQLIRAYARQKRCTEAMLHAAALGKDAPQSPRLGEAHLATGECYALEGNKGEAARVFDMVAVRYPALKEKAQAALQKLELGK